MSKLLRDKAWRVFAFWIKLRDCDADGYCECCTCGEKKSIFDQECHAGHFIPGRSNSVLFREDIVHSQCMRCNFNGGEQAKYLLFMKRKHGMTDAQIEEILCTKRKPVKIKDSDFEDIIRKYTHNILEIMVDKFQLKQPICSDIMNKLKGMGIKKIVEGYGGKKLS